MLYRKEYQCTMGGGGEESAELEDAGVEMASTVGGAFATHGRGEKCREGNIKMVVRGMCGLDSSASGCCKWQACVTTLLKQNSTT
jgi:hypothetical protein